MLCPHTLAGTLLCRLVGFDFGTHKECGLHCWLARIYFIDVLLIMAAILGTLHAGTGKSTRAVCDTAAFLVGILQN